MAVIYWIHLEEHSDHIKEGYIGVTLDLRRRLHRHILAAQQGKKNHLEFRNALLSKFKVEIIFSGSSEECYRREKELRPIYGVGWNLVPGGKGGSKSRGLKMSLEFRQRRSELMRGNKISVGNHKPKSELHRQHISEANRGKMVSEERRKMQSLAMSGRTLTAEHREKIRLSALGKKRGPYKLKHAQLDI